ncbi:hypothetical protein [Sphingobacterium sp. BIGb0116]|uniref:hypothetical protein n=1 Tax=Sphingobacterium sp. BIGb0116 TaxID=2940619 RepID=UPI002167E23E|nr:hypothetical protein [Sphingobacterium sp. BIGb0116]MCS4164777.1 hypothetical protein [Sphingobacterium sp. BIGb0116]
MNSIAKVKTIQEVIDLIDEKVLIEIPENLVNKIAENLLLVERYIRGEVSIKSDEVQATRVFNHNKDKIIEVEYKGIVYK